MLLIREGFTTGLLNKQGIYDIYQNTYLKSHNQEIVHNNISYDTKEASVDCKNKNCQAFVRNEKDGVTDYYTLNDIPYLSNDDYLFTPEELDFSVIPKRKPITSQVVQYKNRNNFIPHVPQKENFNNDITKKEYNKFLSIFLILLVGTLLILLITLPSKLMGWKPISPFKLAQTNLRNEVEYKMNY